MAKNIPEIRIKYGGLLAGETLVAMNEKYGGGKPLRSFEYFQGVADKYRNW